MKSKKIGHHVRRYPIFHATTQSQAKSKELLRYSSVWNYGTVRFWQKVRYGNTYEVFRKSAVRKYGIIFFVPSHTLSFGHSSNARFALLLPNTSLFLFADNFTTSVALTSHHQSPLGWFIRNSQIRDLFAVPLRLLRGQQGDHGPQFENHWFIRSKY